MTNSSRVTDRRSLVDIFLVVLWEICYCPTKLCAWRPNTSLQEEGCIVDISHRAVVLPELIHYLVVFLDQEGADVIELNVC